MMRLVGAPRLAKRWAPVALQSAVQSGLEANGIHGVDITNITTMRAAVVALINAGIEADEISRRLSLRLNTVHVHVSQWRDKAGISRDEHQRIIADAKAARRAGRTPAKPFKAQASVPEVPPDLSAEDYQFMSTIYFSALAEEHRLQTGEVLSLEQVARLSEAEQDRLDRDANIRAARSSWGPRARGDEQTFA